MHACIAALSQNIPQSLAYSKKFIGLWRPIDVAMLQRTRLNECDILRTVDRCGDDRIFVDILKQDPGCEERVLGSIQGSSCNAWNGE